MDGVPATSLFQRAAAPRPRKIPGGIGPADSLPGPPQRSPPSLHQHYRNVGQGRHSPPPHSLPFGYQPPQNGRGYTESRPSGHHPFTTGGSPLSGPGSGGPNGPEPRHSERGRVPGYGYGSGNSHRQSPREGQPPATQSHTLMGTQPHLEPRASSPTEFNFLHSPTTESPAGALGNAGHEDLPPYSHNPPQGEGGSSDVIGTLHPSLGKDGKPLASPQKPTSVAVYPADGIPRAEVTPYYSPFAGPAALGQQLDPLADLPGARGEPLPSLPDPPSEPNSPVPEVTSQAEPLHPTTCTTQEEEVIGEALGEGSMGRPHPAHHPQPQPQHQQHHPKHAAAQPRSRRPSQAHAPSQPPMGLPGGAGAGGRRPSDVALNLGDEILYSDVHGLFGSENLGHLAQVDAKLQNLLCNTSGQQPSTDDSMERPMGMGQSQTLASGGRRHNGAKRRGNRGHPSVPHQLSSDLSDTDGPQGYPSFDHRTHARPPRHHHEGGGGSRSGPSGGGYRNFYRTQTQSQALDEPEF